MAAVITGLSFLRWLLGGHHVPDFWDELELVRIHLASALLNGLIAWTLYMAIEPYVRRLWPTVLLGWSRLLAGRFRDPMIGRDLLIGFTFGVIIRILFCIGWRSPEWFDLPSSFVSFFGLDSMRGGRWAFAELIEELVDLPRGMWFLLLFLLLRIILRKQWLAVVVFVAFMTFQVAVNVASFGSEAVMAVWAIGLGLGLLQAILYLTLMLRFGLVALAGMALLSQWFKIFPTTVDAASPYFGMSLIALLGLAAIALWAFFLSGAGRLAKSA